MFKAFSEMELKQRLLQQLLRILVLAPLRNRMLMYHLLAAEQASSE